MLNSVRPLAAGGVLAAVLLLAGCGGNPENHPESSQAVGELQQIHELYTMAAKSDKPLLKPADFHAKDFEPLYPSAVQGITSGRFVVVWGTAVGAPTVLAYEKEAAEKGGLVVLADGTVQTMTAADLQQATKAKS